MFLSSLFISLYLLYFLIFYPRLSTTPYWLYLTNTSCFFIFFHSFFFFFFFIFIIKLILFFILVDRLNICRPRKAHVCFSFFLYCTHAPLRHLFFLGRDWTHKPAPPGPSLWCSYPSQGIDLFLIIPQISHSASSRWFGPLNHPLPPPLP